MSSQQYCIRGHDTYVVGRTSHYQCRACKTEAKKNSYVPTGRPRGRPPKQVCLNGHDTLVVGRDKSGHCSECRRTSQRELRREQYQTSPEYRRYKRAYYYTTAYLHRLNRKTDRAIQIFEMNTGLKV